MIPSFAPGTLVWLKQDRFPWWPGFVMDPDEVRDITLPEGSDVWVCCLPRDSLTLSAANSEDEGQIRYFLPDRDEGMMEEGKLDASCAVAIEEAIQLYEEQLKAQAGEANERRVRGVKTEFADGGEQKAVEAPQRRKLSLRRGASKHVEERRKEDEGRHHISRKETKSEESGRRHRKKRKIKTLRDFGGDSSESEFAGGSSDDEYGKRTERKRGREDDRDLPNATYDTVGREGSAASADDDVAYVVDMLRKSRHDVTNATLETTGKELTETYMECLNGDVVEVSIANEERIVSLLSSLASANVTLKQLIGTKIGVAVGQFLSDGFPPHIVRFSKGILDYWFRQLPEEVQKQLLAKRALGTTPVGEVHEDKEETEKMVDGAEQ
ncbi:hypothetical protein, conserved [Trypanosoma brucei gambiense DAL972]|uniref:PWWP domain-containing protein n=2 Tax=Trypanosoma brucei TaxID=5691 RepID=C9ZJ96_TRYB9|nr:hypothetical protein, conserved [Trypanosoma brucei gambiense DAL972]RHW73976.1 transcription elongation factor s-II [Trypanosoma brucei equiperdum]CBH09455.1 hypothetical protein, conserved [Trypanosoma brucei gambiense DAL972]|eukprot:XP_011771760.1 hypothetical protein, conserved [Trypanosoma brucei gambiense DAL972]